MKNMKNRLMRFGSVTCITILVFASLVVVEMRETYNAVADTVPPSIINTNTTWDKIGSPYWIEYNVTVTSDATLTIEPGVEVRFNGSYSLIINGDLVAIGDPSDKIIFTSNFSSPNPGDWGSIRFNTWEYLGLYQYNSTIKHATIEYATTGVYCANRTIALENSMIRNNTIGVIVGNESIPFISNNTITNNDENGIDWINTNLPPVVWLRPINWIWNNTITNNGNKGINLITYTFPLIESNHIYSNNYYGVYIYNTNAGVLNDTITDNNVSNNWRGIYLSNSSKTNIINNTISSNTNSGIHLLSSSNNNLTNNHVYDDNFGIYLYSSSNNNLTNNHVYDNNFGIYLQSSSNNNMTGNNISLNDDDGISLSYSSSNDIYDNTISLNVESGISCAGNSDNTITSNDIENNRYGVLSGYGSDPVINYNNIANNGGGASGPGYGIYNFDSSVVIDAQHNWWGHTTGPSDIWDNRAQGGDYNPNGQGDRVRDQGLYIINYRPWTT
jgi:parallel beta-helix repeat protein